MRAAWEAVYPILFGMVAALLWYRFGPSIVKIAADKSWHLDQLYTAVFGFLSITTGFLATFYGTIQSVSDGFIGRIRETRVMNKFLLYLKQGIVAGFAVTILTIPMMIVTPLPGIRTTLANYCLVIMAWPCHLGYWQLLPSSVSSLLFVRN